MDLISFRFRDGHLREGGVRLGRIRSITSFHCGKVLPRCLHCNKTCVHVQTSRFGAERHSKKFALPHWFHSNG